MAAGSLNTFQLPTGWSFTTDAAFRAWGQMLAANLAATGLVKTSDTGQIDWTAVTRPTTATAVAGYEIYRFNDTLQSTVPIYVKVEYGTGNSSTGQNAGLWITVGPATNGAGTIQEATSGMAATSTRRAVQGTASTILSNVVNSYSFGLSDGTGFWVMLMPSAAAGLGGLFFFVERTRNFDGTANSDGYIFGQARSHGAVTVGSEQHAFAYNAVGTQPGSSGASGSAALGGVVQVAGASQAWTSYVVGTTWYPQPLLTGNVPRLQGPSQMILLAGRQDYGNLQTIDIPHYGPTRTWLFAGVADASTSTGWGSCGNGADSFLVRTTG